MKKIFLGCLFFVSLNVKAEALLDLNYFTFSDSLTYSGTYSSAKSIYNVAFMFDVNKKFFVGWNLAGMTVSDSVSSPALTQTFATSDMGPCFRWQIGGKKMYSLNFAYLLSSTVSFSNAGSTETWRGVPMLIRFNVEPELTDNVRLGFALSYYSGTFGTKVVSNTESTVSYSRTWLHPTLSLAYYF